MSDITPDNLSDSEPSMEDILASIRKIIADEEPVPQERRGLFKSKSKSKTPVSIVTPDESESLLAPPLDLSDEEFTSFGGEDLTLIDSLDDKDDSVNFNLIERLDLTEADSEDAQVQNLTEDLLLDDVVLDAPLAASVVTDLEADLVGDSQSNLEADIDIESLLGEDDDVDLEEMLGFDAPEAEMVIDPAADLILATDTDEEDQLDIDDELLSEILNDIDDLDEITEPGDLGLDALADDTLTREKDVASLEDAALDEDIFVASSDMTDDADIALVKSLMSELTEEGMDDEIPEVDDGILEFDDLLKDAIEAEQASPVTGIAATVAGSANVDDADYISDDLASIVAKSSAEAEAARLDAQELQNETVETVAELSEPVELSIDDAPVSAQDDVLDLSTEDIVSNVETVSGEETALEETSSTDEIADSIEAFEEDVAQEAALPEDQQDALDIPAGSLLATGGILAAGAALAAGATSEKTSQPLDDAEISNQLDALIAKTVEDVVEDTLSEELAGSETSPTDTAQTINPTEMQYEDPDMPHIVKSDSIVSETAADEASGAFASLSDAVEQKSILTENGPRIGDLVQDALRPMLQDWLDKNLKTIVERAVAKEIKRISAGK